MYYIRGPFSGRYFIYFLEKFARIKKGYIFAALLAIKSARGMKKSSLKRLKQA